MKLKEVLNKNEYQCDIDVCDIDFEYITTNTEKIYVSSLFIIIKGINFDTGKIINYIINKKPKLIICENATQIDSCDIPIIRVESTRRTIALIYSRYYKINFLNFKFIGITGTNGKTTTAAMIAHILKSAGKRVGVIGTGKIIANGTYLNDDNYSMTTPDPELLYSSIKEMQNRYCEYVVMEVSSHALYFDKVLPIIFDISLFTNFSPEHLDFHKTDEEYLASKLKLFKQSKLAIINIDDETVNNTRVNIKCKIKTCGIEKSADATASDITLLGIQGSKYRFRCGDTDSDINLRLGGKFNIYNSLLAAATAKELGIDEKTIKSALESLEAVDGRLEIIDDEITVIIDYAHTAQAFLEIAKFINTAKDTWQSLTTVFGCGGERDSYKRPLMAKYAEKYSDFVIVTSDNSRRESECKIIKDIISGFSKSKNHKVISSRKKAITEAILSANPRDIVLIIGKGHERYSIDKNGYHSFDEREIIRNALKKRREQ